MDKFTILANLIDAAQPELNRAFDSAPQMPDFDTLNGSEKAFIKYMKDTNGVVGETGKLIAAITGVDLDKLEAFKVIPTIDSVPEFSVVVLTKNPNGNGYDLNKPLLVGPAHDDGKKRKAYGINGQLGVSDSKKGHSTITRQVDSFRPATAEEINTFIAKVDLNGTMLDGVLTGMFDRYVRERAIVE